VTKPRPTRKIRTLDILHVPARNRKPDAEWPSPSCSLQMRHTSSFRGVCVPGELHRHKWRNCPSYAVIASTGPCGSRPMAPSSRGRERGRAVLPDRRKCLADVAGTAPSIGPQFAHHRRRVKRAGGVGSSGGWIWVGTMAYRRLAWRHLAGSRRCRPSETSVKESISSTQLLQTMVFVALAMTPMDM
jgi:hypothetical protein